MLTHGIPCVNLHKFRIKKSMARHPHAQKSKAIGFDVTLNGMGEEIRDAE